jgi:hypothetical protein
MNVPSRLFSRSGNIIPQREDEFGAFMDLLKGEKITSYLEIGARYGDAFYNVVRMLPPGSKAVAVDLPGGPWGRSDSKRVLEECIADLRDLGYAAEAIFGDSTAASTREKVMKLGPYDAAMIDGDHHFEVCKLDWINYSPMARIVAFHDIDGWEHYERATGAPIEVPWVWEEVKHNHRFREIVGQERGMGIGVVFQDRATG